MNKVFSCILCLVQQESRDAERHKIHAKNVLGEKLLSQLYFVRFDGFSVLTFNFIASLNCCVTRRTIFFLKIKAKLPLYSLRYKLQNANFQSTHKIQT